MIYIIIVAVGVLGVLLLGSQAMSSPSPRKAFKRRMELIKERHGEGGARPLALETWIHGCSRNRREREKRP